MIVSLVKIEEEDKNDLVLHNIEGMIMNRIKTQSWRKIVTGGIFFLFGIFCLWRLDAEEVNKSIDVSDNQIELQARSILAKDSECAQGNFGVDVEKGCATIWGTTTSAKQAKRAKDLVSKINGIRSVKLDLQINAPVDELVEKIGRDVRQSNNSFSRSSLNPMQSNSNRIDGSPTPILSMNSVNPPLKALHTNSGQLVRQGNNETGRGSPNMPHKSSEFKTKAVTLLRPNLQTTTDMESWLRGVVRQDKRFSNLKWEWKSPGILLLSGKVDRVAEVWKLADQLRDFKEVKSIILGNFE